MGQYKVLIGKLLDEHLDVIVILDSFVVDRNDGLELATKEVVVTFAKPQHPFT